jgi:hypothetical protein
LEGGGHLVVVEAYSIETESIYEQCPIRERFLENMDEVQEQVEDDISGNFELVSSEMVFSTLHLSGVSGVTDQC